MQEPSVTPIASRPGPARGRRAFLLAAFVGALAGAFAAGAGGLPGPHRVAQAPRAGSGTAVPAPEARPFRVGMWVRQETLADPEGVRAAVALARQAGVDTLVVQVLARGQAAYRSSIWPGESGWDPLGTLLGAASRAGLSVYAWVNAYTWGRLDLPPADPQHPLARHPEWVTADRTGRSLWRYRVGERPEVSALFVDPALEGVRQTIVETVLEIARRYDVDGIELDYIRYPAPDLGFHPLALRDFWGRLAPAPSAPAGTPAALGEPGGAVRREPVAAVALPYTPQERQAWDRYRTEQVTRLVREASAARSREGLPLRLSAAVLPEAERARQEFFQDWPSWLAEGLVDELHLMSYTTDPRQLQRWVQEAVEASPGRPVLAGIGVYRIEAGQAGLLPELVRAAREAGAAGVLYFSFESLEGRPDLVEAARQALYPSAAGGPGSLR